MSQAVPIWSPVTLRARGTEVGVDCWSGAARGRCDTCRTRSVRTPFSPGQYLRSANFTSLWLQGHELAAICSLGERKLTEKRSDDHSLAWSALSPKLCTASKAQLFGLVQGGSANLHGVVEADQPTANRIATGKAAQ